MNEPRIEINGQQLSAAQAMTVRVACTSYLEEMANPDALGSDALGRQMTAAYSAQLAEVLRIMLSQ